VGITDQVENPLPQKQPVELVHHPGIPEIDPECLVQISVYEVPLLRDFFPREAGFLFRLSLVLELSEGLGELIS